MEGSPERGLPLGRLGSLGRGGRGGPGAGISLLDHVWFAMGNAVECCLCLGILVDDRLRRLQDRTLFLLRQAAKYLPAALHSPFYGLGWNAAWMRRLCIAFRGAVCGFGGVCWLVHRFGGIS